jgi:hypothetical protein
LEQGWIKTGRNLSQMGVSWLGIILGEYEAGPSPLAVKGPICCSRCSEKRILICLKKHIHCSADVIEACVLMMGRYSFTNIVLEILELNRVA